MDLVLITKDKPRNLPRIIRLIRGNSVKRSASHSNVRQSLSAHHRRIFGRGGQIKANVGNGMVRVSPGFPPHPGREAIPDRPGPQLRKPSRAIPDNSRDLPGFSRTAPGHSYGGRPGPSRITPGFHSHRISYPLGPGPRNRMGITHPIRPRGRWPLARCFREADDRGPRPLTIDQLTALEWGIIFLGIRESTWSSQIG